MKVLTFSTLFPSSERPGHGIFVETRLRHLVASGQIQSRVVAPVPWFPFRNRRFGQYASFARTPIDETRGGLRVLHPRYPLLPKIGMTAAPFLLAHAVKPALQRLIDEGFDFDLIDAHYFYPDGVAAVLLGRHFNKPVVITARGSDITLLPRYHLPRKMIEWAAARASGIITVCHALKEEISRIGIAADRIKPLRNGVDLQLFHPGDRECIRNSLGVTGFTLLSTGNLVPLKGHDLVISSLPLLKDVRLLIAGSGPEKHNLVNLARQLQVTDRVTFLGTLPQPELKNYYCAADALVLASSREGWANVLLEAMACGTPVAASRVWGTPEVVTAPEAGVLMEVRSVKGIAQAVRSLQSNYPDRAATRRYAERFSWDETTAGQIELFHKILKRS
ncbi:MAG TPA: glycosyltransferase family 4 protein [Noviherbaspirillum sp.]|nr:glycosyltransferase family 4 protein [Noviherbaspirillum sp.]